jgi:hypothetical protein
MLMRIGLCAGAQRSNLSWVQLVLGSVGSNYHCDRLCSRFSVDLIQQMLFLPSEISSHFDYP